MFDNQIMAPGKKIKKMREFIGATQGEIAEGICTRNSISQIENNKQKITFNLAIGIAKNFNKLAKKKEIYISPITENELMKDEDSQANYIFRNNIINDLSKGKSIDIFERKLYEAEKITEKYKIADSEKLELYKLAANFYYEQCSYFKSDEMCNKAITICIYTKNRLEEANFYVNKARVYNEIKLAHESLEQLIKAEKIYNDTLDNELFKKLYYNKALAYKKINKYQDSLECLELLIRKTIDDKNMLLKAKMLHANCLNEQSKFEQAKKEYMEIINIADKDFLVMAYRNLSELYLNEEDYESAGIYIKESLQHHTENEYLSETLYFAAKVFQKLNEDVEDYLLKALDICEKNDRENLELIEEIIYELLLIYIEKENETNIISMAEKAEILKIDCSLIYIEIVEYYIGRKKEKSIYFSRKLKNKIKLTKKI